jgi:hypothetical protein
LCFGQALEKEEKEAKVTREKKQDRGKRSKIGEKI